MAPLSSTKGNQVRALVIYSRVGGGHLSAARALAEAFETTAAVQTRLVDAYLECARFPVTLFPRAYAELARHHPQLWALLFHGSNRGLDPKRVLGPFLRQGLRKCIAEYRPDVVVSVLPVINVLVAEVAPRTEVVLTDWHSVHRFWVARGVDHYTAPTESARLDCIRFGAPRERVEVIGIPVRRAFAANQAPSAKRDRFTVLMMVGAEGSPRALANVQRLLQLDLDAQALVVCGRNEELRRRVQALPTRLTVEALGFVDNIAELMRGADVLVTKAGGLTLAEAFCCAVPVVVYDVLPGQEAGNLAYALSQDAVAHARSPGQLGRVISELYSDSARRAELARRGHALARPDAATRIVANVLKRLGT
jgi:UDP-N-acetylglucosamine:LPS N-acetylglucosamine transferase